MKIHKEGYQIIRVASLILLAIVILAFFLFDLSVFLVLTLASLLLLAFLTRFFRVPERIVDQNDNMIYSSADGTVVAIEEVEENEFFHSRCIQVSVFMSVWNVHINWFPSNGRVEYVKYHDGNYLVARHPKSSTHNERTSVVVEHFSGQKYMIRQIAGAVARRIVCYAKENNEVIQGTELGFIKFGSRVDLFLPLNSKIMVGLNQKVKGTQTVIAELLNS